MLAGWHSALMSNPGSLQWLKERRGLHIETLQNYQIGLKDGRLYTLPVRSPDGDIWNVRYYNPNPPGERRKIWGERGYNSPPRLYPIGIFDDDPAEVIIGEGEWDVLLAIQSGFCAITRTSAADVWDMGWGDLFAGRIVYLAHDCDTKGQKANRQIGRALDKIADVRVLELPYEITEKHGKDLTDFLLDHEPQALRDLMDHAPKFGKSREHKEPETVTVLDAFDARRVGDPLRLIVTIRGRKEPGYVIPKQVRLACTQDAGNKCAACPLRAANGEAIVKIAEDDPLILGLIDSPTDAVRAAIAGAYGVPGAKCSRLQQEVEEHQAVEILFARPALDYTDGVQEEHKNLKITNVGRHDTSANNTVAVVGALQPNPRSQGNEFLGYGLEKLQTNVDKFEVTPETVRLMKRFQATKKPLTKLAEINKAVAQHVTHIHGRPEMHALIDLTFHSVLSFDFAGERVSRGWIESLILGDTGTGKSTAAKRLISHYGAGEMVNCEAATFAGVVGGVQQLGGRDWAVTWGAIPLNDRRLVVLDEVSGLTREDISQMSDVRSSGQAKLTKIIQESTWSRTRLLWMGNPRGATMERFTYGVDALSPLIGNAEDIARFDLAMAVTKHDVPSEVINQPTEDRDFRYTPEACHTLLMWVWSRLPEQITWEEGAEALVLDQANDIGRVYTEEPPLILASSVRIKIARIAVAIAARLFSTDESFENVVVCKEHVMAAVQFLNLIYGQPAFGYRERSRQYLSDKLEAEQKRDEIEQYLLGSPSLAKYLSAGIGKFRRQDLEEILNISREEANGIINTLWEARMVRKELGDVRVQPTLHALLREIKW
jgi:hypothetical protein